MAALQLVQVETFDPSLAIPPKLDSTNIASRSASKLLTPSTLPFYNIIYLVTDWSLECCLCRIHPIRNFVRIDFSTSAQILKWAILSFVRLSANSIRPALLHFVLSSNNLLAFGDVSRNRVDRRSPLLFFFFLLYTWVSEYISRSRFFFLLSSSFAVANEYAWIVPLTSTVSLS